MAVLAERAQPLALIIAAGHASVETRGATRKSLCPELSLDGGRVAARNMTRNQALAERGYVRRRPPDLDARSAFSPLGGDDAIRL
jgi:hypothetical protein